MKASRIILTLTLTLALMTAAGSATAQIKLTDTEAQKLYITVHTVGTAQTLDHKNVFNATGAALPKVEPGFQNAFGDLGFIGKFGKKQEIEVVFDLYLSSRFAKHGPGHRLRILRSFAVYAAQDDGFGAMP